MGWRAGCWQREDCGEHLSENQAARAVGIPTKQTDVTEGRLLTRLPSLFLVANEFVSVQVTVNVHLLAFLCLVDAFHNGFVHVARSCKPERACSVVLERVVVEPIRN